MSPRRSIDERTTLEDLAALVCTTLDEHGISVVLSGGAVASIYSNAEYVSYDLDFVPIGLARKVDGAMKSLGFERQQRHWRHKRTRYWVEFPAGPVAVGEETIHEFAERTNRMGTLRLLAPSECVMDRLAWYIHNADPQCLEQAVQVARAHAIDLRRIERWARGEGPRGEERFREFERRLAAGKKSRHRARGKR